MANLSNDQSARAKTVQRSVAVDWLSLAATPTFSVMAWISATEAVPGAICTAGAGPLPFGGMVTMYLLMSVFHLSPWLKLASGRLRKPS